MSKSNSTISRQSNPQNTQKFSLKVGTVAPIAVPLRAKFQPLVKDTKSYVSLENKGLDIAPTLQQVEKFALQDVACSILNDKIEVRRKKDTVKTYAWRVNYCLKQRVSVDDDITVRYNAKRQKSHYHNLQRCGSVWTCPVCASQIAEGRRKELQQATAEWRKKGGKIYMMTLTNRHHLFNNLDDLMRKQAKATKRFWETTKVRDTLNEVGYFGRITALEVTHGSNGWHPHFHILLFLEQEVDTQDLHSKLAPLWQSSCVKSGMQAPTLEHGLHIQDGSYAELYISKYGLGSYTDKEALPVANNWGIESEMTKGHTKKGRKGSVTPFDMLRLAESDPKYVPLFREFAEQFRGKRQLVWSAGLKSALLISEISDDELATMTENDSVEINVVFKEFWRLILRYRARGRYLKAVEDDYLYGTWGDRIKDSRAGSLILELLEVEQLRLSKSRR